MRILSGIQPSGTLHLGNYFGMMRPAIELQEKGEAFYFIADYHSMTSLFDANERRKNTLDVALDFLACGLDPKKSVFFKQSDVPEVTELAWLLSTLHADGACWKTATATKTKSPKALRRNHGLFAYPVLMAADILIYDSNIVPVGHDQKQHVEVTRDIAIKFNEHLRRDVRDSRSRKSATRRRGRARHGRPENEQELRQHALKFSATKRRCAKKSWASRWIRRTPAEPKPDADKNLAVQLLKLVAPAEVAAGF